MNCSFSNPKGMILAVMDVEKPKKIRDFNEVWTRDLAIPVQRSNQLSYEATTLGAGHLRFLIFPWGVNQWTKW